MTEANVLLMTHEVATRLGVSHRTIHRWVAQGRLTPRKYSGNRPYYDPSDIDALAAERRRVLLAKAALLAEVIK